MKVYIINMERSLNRRKAMEAQMQALGLDYTFIGAVDGRLMSDDELNNIIEKPGEFTKSQAGCMLSHCKVYEAMQQQADEYALILEDDVVITEPKFKQFLADLTQQLDKNSISLLTYYWCRENTLSLSKTANAKKISGSAEDYFICKPSEIHGIGRAAAYILSKEKAKAILDFHKPVLICQADSWVVYYERGLLGGVDCVYPMPVTENHEFGSEIGYTRNAAESFGKKMVAKALEMKLPIIGSLIKKKRENFAQRYKNIELKN